MSETSTDEVVERLNSKIGASEARPAPPKNNRAKTITLSLNEARQIIEALSTRPLQVPTPEVTEAMIEAGLHAYHDWRGGEPRTHAQIIAAIYTAMSQKAAPAAPSEKAVTIPRDVAEQVLSMGRVEWGATDAFTEAGHLAHLQESLRITREHFNFEDVPVAMHGLYLDGTGTVLCHTGTSPNSGANAQALAGAWNWLHDQCVLAATPPKPAE